MRTFPSRPAWLFLLCCVGVRELGFCPPRPPQRASKPRGCGRTQRRSAEGQFLNQTLWKPYALSLLQDAKFFRDLTPGQLDETADLMMVELVEPGETVFNQGDPGDKFFIVADGNFKAYVVQPPGEAGVPPKEEMVKHYGAGEYFGELALLTKAPRRASLRCSGDQQGVLLWISRHDFERTLGSLKELLLRNAAFRPASRALKQEEQLAKASPWEQVFGLPGSTRRLVLTVLVYLVAGTGYYTYTGFEELDRTSPAVALYFCIETALAVGFGVLTPRGSGSPFFTSAFVISGAAILVNFLSGVFADVLEEAEEKRRRRDGEARVLFSTTAPLVVWWLVGVAYGRLHEGWDWGKATLFAVSATSSVGIQGLDSQDDSSLLACACYLLVGVPLYASVIARVSILVADDIIRRRQQEIKKRAIMALDGCDEECKLDVFSMYDVDQDGFITKEDIPELLKFLSASRGVDIGPNDIDFLLEEFDKDGSGQINQQEFLGGLTQWQVTVKESMTD